MEEFEFDEWQIIENDREDLQWIKEEIAFQRRNNFTDEQIKEIFRKVFIHKGMTFMVNIYSYFPYK